MEVWRWLTGDRYATVVFEVAAVVTTSSVWSGTAFRKTHLIERMGLLTLIVLGEGIIVMLKAINTIVKGFGWTKSSFGVVVAAMAIIVVTPLPFSNHHC